MLWSVTGILAPEICKYDGLGFNILFLEDRWAEHMSDEDSKIQVKVNEALPCLNSNVL